MAKSMTNYLRTQTARTAINTTIIDTNVDLIGPSDRKDAARTYIQLINGSRIPLPASYNTTSPPLVQGTAYSLEPFFNVRWAWITLPALLTLISPAFVLATIWASYKSGTPVLGSGLRALVGCHVDDEIRGRVGDVDSEDELEKRAKSVKIELKGGKEEGGWRIGEIGREASSEA
jgi:hypothetical protein